MLANAIHKKQQRLHEQHLLRQLASKEESQHLLSFCSNDYLQLATHPDVIHALQKGAAMYGLGSGGSAQLGGFTKAHLQLQEEFAAFLKRDQALLFNSGYHANLGVITTYADRHSHIVTDKLCHASIIDGILLSRAKHQRFRHSDYDQAANLVRAQSLLISESVFSMQGDIANIKRLADIATTQHATLMVDDAHGVGILGHEGRGTCEYFQLSQQSLPLLITPLGKALGSMGAIVSGSKDMIEPLIQLARTHRYSTLLPPAIAVATSTALAILQKDTWRREALQALITFFIQEAAKRELPLASHDATPIKTIMTQSNALTLRLQAKLREQGMHVACIRPPTVPHNQACMRISLTIAHTEQQIIQLLDLLKDGIDDNKQN